MESLSNNVGSTSKMRIIYNPPFVQPWITYKIKIFVNSQLVESFSSRDTISLEIPIQVGQTTITIQAAFRKQTIKSSIDASKDYSLNIKYNHIAGKWKGVLSLSSTNTNYTGPSSSDVDSLLSGHIKDREHRIKRLAIVLCLALLIGIGGYFVVGYINTHNTNSDNKENTYNQEKVPCIKCGGTGKNSTPLIDRNITDLNVSDNCDLCGGTGWISKDVEAFYMGLHVPMPTPSSVLDEYEECYDCHGLKKCPFCAGIGQCIYESPYSSEKIITKCEWCHGSGLCHTCAGKGKIRMR